MTAPAGALSIFPLRSSGRSRRSSLPFSTAPAVPAPAGAFTFVSPLALAVHCLQQERYPVFFPTCHSSVLLQQEALLFSPHLPRSSAPLPRRTLPIIFLHCRSSVRSPSRTPIYISPLPQQCPFPQDALPIISPLPQQCLATPRRSSINTSPLPQQWLHPTGAPIYVPTAAAYLPSHLPPLPTKSTATTSTLQQKPRLLPLEMPQHLYKHCPAVPSALNHASFGGGVA